MLFLAACGAPPDAGEAVAEAAVATAAEPVAVRVAPVERRAFPLRTIATGRLRAARQAEIRLRAEGQLVELPIEAGAYVEEGALLARVDDAALRLRLRQARLQLDDAQLNKDDLLLAQGGRAGVDTSVSAEKLLLIHTLSGYDKALLAVEQAEYELSLARVEAPFAGIVADLQARAFQQARAGDPVCTLLDPASFEAEFQLLESEALTVEPGRRVRVRPLALSGGEWAAAVSRVNPVVDEQGLVTVHARLQGDAPRRFEGMNVEVVLEQPTPGLLVVPKSAVVLRSGRPVVFTYAAEEGLAKWHYVAVAHENDEQIALSEGPDAGALVIYEGNLNLDHDAAVRLAE